MNELLYGVAYYDEYMPYERLDKDIELMKAANINVVRIAESTWSTHEPQNGVFDFSSVDRVLEAMHAAGIKVVDRVLEAMHAAGIKVIIGTPTYAVPTWMVKEHPDVLAVTSDGPMGQENMVLGKLWILPIQLIYFMPKGSFANYLKEHINTQP